MVWRTIGAIVAAAIAACSTPSDTVTAPSRSSSGTPSRPNILFLLADDMRADAMGVVGNEIVETPNLDALAQKGVLFENMYVTTPICAISRASIFTGEYASRHGILDFDTDFTPGQLDETYPSLMRAADYRSGFIGKYGVGDFPAANAFDYWKGFTGQGKYETTDSLGQPIHLTHLQSEQARAFLASQPKNKPFVLSVSFKAPHVQDEDPRQFIPEAQDMSLYAGVTIPTPVTATDSNWNQFPLFFRTNNEGRIRWGWLFSTPAMYQNSVKGYYRLITGMDRAIGEILAELNARGLASNTIVVFSSDNGFFLGEHGLAHKWYSHDQSVRVPLIIYDPRDPSGQGGRTETSIALNVDIAPTLLDAVGLPIPPMMQGQSLMPVVHGKATTGRSDFYFEHHFNLPTIRQSEGVIGGQYKYIKYTDPKPNYEYLYDLTADPTETTNFAQDPRYQAILARLRQRYADLKAQAR